MNTLKSLTRYYPLVDDWQAFSKAVLRPLPRCLWVNTLRISSDEIIPWLRRRDWPEEQVPWQGGAYRLPANADAAHSLAYLAGWIHLQEEVSMLPVHLLDPQPGERVLDLCAAPGNKTAQMAVRMGNTGIVMANDVSGGRLNILRTTRDRLGLLNLAPSTGDAATFEPTGDRRFDRVLADVPCSCEGTSRKHPHVLQQTSPENSRRLSKIQCAILIRAVDVCRAGGRIVYATCTYAPEENEAVVDAALRHFGRKHLRLVPALVPHLQYAPGLTQWGDQVFADGMSRCLRIWPHQNDTGGFFVAVLEKGFRVPTTATPEPPVRSKFDPAPALRLLKNRFGIPPSAFDGLSLFRKNDNYVSITTDEIRSLNRSTPEGLSFIKTNLTHHKLTTQAAMCFGHAADKNFVSLEAHQVRPYLHRQRFYASMSQVRRCTGFGYVIIRFGAHSLGMGMYRPVVGGAWIDSLFPKNWAGVHLSTGHCGPF